MKKRLSFIFFLAVITAGGILIFQVYWVYNTYKTGERNFTTLITNALEKSIESYPLQQINLPTSLNAKSPSLSVMSSFTETPHNLLTKGERKEMPGRLYNVKLQPLSVSSRNLALVQQILATLIAQAKGKPLQLDLLKKLFRNELKKDNIDLPFQLVLLKNQTKLPPGVVAAFLPFSNDNSVVKVNISGSNHYLLEENAAPAAVSLLLILLSASCIYYMGYIIRLQIKTDELKNDFINNITHELRTPISILKSTHEALLKFGEHINFEKNIRYLTINTDILNKLENNVDRILEIRQYEHGLNLLKIEPVNIDQLIMELIEKFEVENSVKITYAIRLNEQVWTDRFAMEIIVSNLLDNAIKYNAFTHNKSIIIETGRLNKGWQLQLKDNGPGIDEQYLPFIFDKFYRVPSGDLHNVKGYGLGLSYVRELVTSLGGRIEVKSRLSIGTTFSIQFSAYG